MRSEFVEQNAGAPDQPLGAIRQGFPEEETREEDREFLSKGIVQAKAKRPTLLRHLFLKQHSTCVFH